MKVINRRSFADLLRGFFLLGHPGPVGFHMLAVTILILLASWPRVQWGTFLLLFTAHLAMQLSIAIMNDYCDRERDAMGKKPKPIVMGLVRPKEALVAASFLMILMVLLLVPLNPLALVVSLLYLACGQGYNFGLKSTPLSGIVFALAIPLIPVYAFVGVGRFLPIVFWQMPVVALLGVALNLANALPDIEEDAASQSRTLAVTLGLRGSLFTSLLLIFVAALLSGLLALTGLVPAQPLLLITTLIFVGMALLMLLFLFGLKTTPQNRKQYFYLIILLCLIFAAAWITSVIIG